MACLLAEVSYGQSGVQAPVAGNIFDPRSGAVRPIVGLPGSWLLGAPVTLGVTFDSAIFAKRSDFALGMLSDRSQLALATGLRSSAPVVTPLPAAIRADLIAMDSSETIAVVYSTDGQQLQFISGLPDAPGVSNPISLASLDAPVTALAAAGNYAAIATSDGQNGSIYAQDAQGDAPTFVTAVHGVTSMKFLASGSDLVVADAITNELDLVRDVTLSPRVAVLATQADGVSQTVGIQTRGKHIFVANAGSQTVLIYDLDSGLIRQVSIAVPPSTLDPLNNGWLLINHVGSDPVYVMNPADATVFFIPVGD